MILFFAYCESKDTQTCLQLLRLPHFAFCHCKPIYYRQNLHIDISKYQQIQI